MPRLPHIQYPEATDHVTSRGNVRREVDEDDDDRRPILIGLVRVSEDCGWYVLAFFVTNNHLHLMVRAPQPNLASGMHRFLSTYAFPKLGLFRADSTPNLIRKLAARPCNSRALADELRGISRLPETKPPGIRQAD